MSLSPAFRPNETSTEIFSEHTWLQGAFLGAVAYGMEAVLFSMSFYLLFNQRKRDAGTHNRYLLVYISIIFLLSTLYMVALLQFTQESFIDNRNIDGGPNEFENVEYSIPIDMLGNVTLIILSWMCDIINVWRCVIIYRNSRVPIWIVCFVPVGMYLTSVAFGILWLKQVSVSAASPWATSGINWTIPYYTLSLALNILVTLLIVARLLLCRYRIGKVMGTKHGAHYASLAAMVVESAFIYSAFALLFLVPFALNSPIAQLFLQSLSPVQTVSTFLIIFRVAQGKGWSSEKVKAAMTSTIGSARTPIRIRAVTSTMRDGLGSAMSHDSGNTTKIHTSTIDFENDVRRKEGYAEAV